MLRDWDFCNFRLKCQSYSFAFFILAAKCVLIYAENLFYPAYKDAPVFTLEQVSGKRRFKRRGLAPRE